MKIAIDGPAGSGKSTVARALAERCGITYLDTGALYRSIASECLYRGIDPTDDAAVAEVAREVTITFGPMVGGKQDVFVDGRDVTVDIRTPEVDKAVTPVSANPQVREAMLGVQRSFGEEGSVVAEGRDIGTVIFPDAEVKVFLTADPAARALRRAVQRAGGNAATDANATAPEAEIAAILADLQRRDKADSSRAVAPLKPAEDAVHIDSSFLSVDEVIDAILNLNDELKEMDHE